MTGEHPAAKAETPLSDNTNIKLGFVVTIIVAAMSVGGLYYQVKQQGEEIAELRADQKATEKEQARMETRLTVSEGGFRTLTEQVAKANEKLDRLLEARTERSVYRPQSPRGPGGQ